MAILRIQYVAMDVIGLRLQVGFSCQGIASGFSNRHESHDLADVASLYQVSMSQIWHEMNFL